MKTSLKLSSCPENVNLTIKQRNHTKISQITFSTERNRCQIEKESWNGFGLPLKNLSSNLFFEIFELAAGQVDRSTVNSGKVRS